MKERKDDMKKADRIAERAQARFKQMLAEQDRKMTRLKGTGKPIEN